MSYFGKISIEGYSEDNRYIAFGLILFKPIKMRIAYGVYDSYLNKTYIALATRNCNYIKDINKIIDDILSTNDWNENVKYEQRVIMHRYCKY